MAFSTLQNNSAGLQKATASRSKPHESLDVQSLLGGGNKGAAQIGVCGKVITLQETEQKFFTAAVLEPKWQYMMDSDIHFHRTDRDHITWELKLGDVIAVKTNNAEVAEESTFPFLCPWIPCQLIAMFSSDESPLVEKLKFEVRYLPTKETTGKGMNLCEIDSVLPSEAKVIAETDILGPVGLFLNGEKESGLDWASAPKRLPYPIVYLDKKTLPKFHESIQVSKCYTEECLAKILDAVVGDAALTNGEDKETTTSSFDGKSSTESRSGKTCVAGTCANPIFVNVSQLRIFFREFWIVPQLHLFDTGLTVNKQTPDQSAWNLRVGDVVLIDCEGPKRYPFRCNWGGKWI
jgi:hypothetical protein